MKRLAWFLGVFFTFQASWASSECDKHLVKADPMLQLSPAETKYLIGMLFELKPDQYIFAFQDYVFGNHEAMFSLVASSFEVTKVIWCGEVAVSNGGQQPSRGRIHMTVNTSGFAAELLRKGWLESNDPIALGRILANSGGDLVTKDVRHLAHSDQTAHIFPLFQMLHQFNLRDARGDLTARHRIVNVLASVFMFFSPTALPSNFSWQRELEVIRRDLNKEKIDVFIQFCGSLSESGLEPPAARCVSAARDALTRFKHGEIRSEHEFTDLLRSVTDFGHKIQREKHPVGFVIFP